MKKVLVTGTFDIIHPGHLSLLQQARHHGTHLTVVIARDETVFQVKNYFPYFTQAERIRNLKKLGVAHRVIPGGQGDKLKIIVKEKPDVLCLGYDQLAFTDNLQTELSDRGLPTRVARLKRFRPDKHKTGLLHRSGLVAIKNIDPSIHTDPRYATPRNILKKPLYHNAIVLVRQNVAAMLVRAQRLLKKHGVGLHIWDGYRPLSVQKKFWAHLPDERYIGDPAIFPSHTRGAAVDCTLYDLKTGKLLEMPTGFDEFTPRAHRAAPQQTPTAHTNMLLLEKMMVRVGFATLPTEWWHFHDPRWRHYPKLDMDI